MTEANKGQRGFTLLELLAVMAILATLVAIVVPAVTGSREASLQAQALQDAMQVRTAASKYFGQVQASEVRTSHTVTTTTSLPAGSGQDASLAPLEPATAARQTVSSRWPERFITIGQAPPADVSAIGAGYGDVVQTVPAPAVESVLILGSDGKTLAGKTLLERYTAVDLDTLAAQGFLAKKPSAADLRSDNIPNFLWLFEKTSSSNTPEREDDSRDVAVFKLVKVEQVEGTGNVKATFGQILGEAVTSAPEATSTPSGTGGNTPTPTATSTATPTQTPTPTATAQVKNPAWVTSYNGPGNASDSPQRLALDAQGNLYVTGTSYGVGTSVDYATIKYDANGNQLWAARYNGPGNDIDIVRAMVVDGQSNVYVTGRSTSADEDYATIKYDTNGNQLWVARYSGGLATALVVDGQGSVYVTGQSWGAGTTYEYATVKYDTNGNQLWVARYNGGGISSNGAAALAVDGQGKVYVTGRSGDDYATVKYDANGNQLWAARYNGPGTWNAEDVATALAVDGQGNVYVTGYSDGVGRSDYATIKYDANGNQVWVARYDGAGNGYDRAVALAVDGQGNLYVTGYSPGAGTNDDYATVKYDANGNQLWVARYNGAGNGYDQAAALAVDGQGNVYVTGTSSLPGAYAPDFATIKYDANGNPLWVGRYGGVSGGGITLVVDGQGNVYVTGDASDYTTIKYTAP